MTILTAAVIAALAAQSAFAEQRANKPFNTANGRTTAGPAEAPRVFTVTKPGGGAGSNTAAPDISAPAIATAVNIAGGGGMGIAGGGRRSAARTTGGSRRSGKAFWGGRNVDAPAPAPAPEEAPPHFSKPGALIRTTGQAPVYEKAETPRTHTVDAGSIVLSKHKIFDVGRNPGVHIGPKDTPPPPNPGTGGNYGTGATANSGPTTTADKPKNNNGSGNNDKDKPGDDFDDHGGGNPRDLVGDSINAAF